MVGANGADAEEEPTSSQAPKKRSRWGAREEPVVDGTAAAAPGGEDGSEVKRQRKSKVALYAYVFIYEPMSGMGAV
jgi:hypothetical protein